VKSTGLRLGQGDRNQSHHYSKIRHFGRKDIRGIPRAVSRFSRRDERAEKITLVKERKASMKLDSIQVI